MIAYHRNKLQALIDAEDTPALSDAQIVLILSSRKAAYGLCARKIMNKPSWHLVLQQYLKAALDHTRTTYNAEIMRIVLDTCLDIVVLAGWMHVMSEPFLDAVINIHPAFPGAFGGAHAIERSYEVFQKGDVGRVGTTVHRVYALWKWSIMGSR
jgi:phosphoribosylglycinamide formyltransferase